MPTGIWYSILPETGAGGELRFVGNGMAEYASGERFRILPEQFNGGVVTAEDMLKLMDDNGVDKMVLLQGNYIGFQNLYSLEAVKNIQIGSGQRHPMIRLQEQGTDTKTFV